MSDKKDLPHPEPPYIYIPGTLNALVEYVENYLEKKLKKFFFVLFLVYSASLLALAVLINYSALEDSETACCFHFG